MVKIPASLGESSNQHNDTNNVNKIISEYKNHPSILRIKETYKYLGNFDLPKANPKDTSDNKIFKLKKSNGF